MAGLIGVTGVADSVSPYISIFIGVIAGFFYILGTKITMMAGVDDPIEASIVHGFGGLWGCLATALLHEHKGLVPL